MFHKHTHFIYLVTLTLELDLLLKNFNLGCYLKMVACRGVSLSSDISYWYKVVIIYENTTDISGEDVYTLTTKINIENAVIWLVKQSIQGSQMCLGNQKLKWT